MLSLATLLFGASLLLLVSCKGGGNKETAFDIQFIKVWGEPVNLKNNSVTVAAGTEKTVEVKIKNCNEFELSAGDGVASGAGGAATAKNIAISKGDSTLTITLKATGFPEKKLHINVTRKDKEQEFRVKMKREASGVAFKVGNGSKMQTTGNDAVVIVEADYEMSEVKIGNTTGTLAGDSKSATATVPVGNVQVMVKFVDYEVSEGFKSFAFNIAKVAEDQLAMTCANATLFIGDVMKTPVDLPLEFEGENVAKWTNNAEDPANSIQYSLVKVEMEFDAPISNVKIDCKDERKDKYTTNPVLTDFGAFSGRLVKTLKEERGPDNSSKMVAKELNHINGNKYTEYFIAGVGKVIYKLTFESTNRKPSTYTIEINNPVKFDQDGEVEEGMQRLDVNKTPKVKVWDYNGNNGIPVNAGFFTALPCYHKGPMIKKGQGGQLAFAVENMNRLEVMGRLQFTIDRSGPAANADEEGSICFYYTLYDDPAQQTHEFVRYEPFGGDFNGSREEYIQTRINATDKYFDGFVGFKNCLPQPICNNYLENKVKAIAKYGFLANVFAVKDKKDKPGEKEANLIHATVAQTYRQQAVYASKVENGFAEAEEKTLTFAKNTKWKTWVLGEPVKTGPTKEGEVVVLSGEDILPVYMCFDPDEKYANTDPKNPPKYPEVTFSISRSTDGQTYTPVKVKVKDEEKESVIAPRVKLLSGDEVFVAGMPPFDPKQDRPDLLNGFRFKEKEAGATAPNVYKVEMKVKISEEDPKEYTYTYILDYRANEINLELASEDFSSFTSDIFGLPLSYDAVEELPMRESSFARRHLEVADF